MTGEGGDVGERRGCRHESSLDDVVDLCRCHRSCIDLFFHLGLQTLFFFLLLNLFLINVRCIVVTACAASGVFLFVSLALHAFSDKGLHS